MAKKKKSIPQKLVPWVEARKKFKLSHGHVQMARELGINPKKLGKLDNHDQEPWKRTLKHYIQHLYFKRFGRDWPEQVRSIEQMVEDRKKKKEAQRKHKQERQNQETIPAEPESPEDPF